MWSSPSGNSTSATSSGAACPGRNRTTRPRWQSPGTPPGNQAPPPVDKSAQDNIFGGDLISEKSLDEVILAYLSEDLNDK